MQAFAVPSSLLPARARVRFRPPPAALILYFGLLLAIELVAEAWLSNQAPLGRALMRWSLLVLAMAPVSGLVVWKSCQADQVLADAEQRERIRALALALAAESNPDDVLDLLLIQARELSGASMAFLARPDSDGYRVETVTPGPLARLKRQRLPISSESPGLAGEALRTGRPVALADTWCEAGLAARREIALTDRVRSAAVIPLVVRGEVLGLLVLHAETTGRIGPEQIALFTLYAEQASGPFVNALLAASVGRLDTAEQLDRLKSEFLSAVAHELRAPLSPMLGWSELLLLRDFSPEHARPMLESIRDGAEHLSVLVGDLLDLARGEAGRLNLDVQELQLDELLESAVARWREQASDHNLVLAVAGSIPIRGDRHRLRQVLDNLLSNAAKYSPAETRIFVTAREDANRQVSVRVSDQGIGLTPEECERLFAKFYRTDAARRQASGTGLGLVLCRLIVGAHGGQITVESEGPGCGCVFSFTLPIDGPTVDLGETSASFAAIRG